MSVIQLAFGLGVLVGAVGAVVGLVAFGFRLAAQPERPRGVRYHIEERKQPLKVANSR